MTLNSIEEILNDIRQGKMVVIMDDEDRENEGDLVMAASKVRPEDVNFMARYGRGLICLALTRERCKQLNLPLMVKDNTSPYTTNFTVSIEAAEGVTTGISAYDRAHTIRIAVAPDARPENLVQPGHIFPLMAQAGGVLTRAGHTEAGCDLAGLAGLEPAAVLVEILKEDGSMARRPDLQAFAVQHDLKIGTIADLIRYSMVRSSTVNRIAKVKVPTEYGEFTLYTYQDIISEHLHFALVRGEIDSGEAIPVRVQLPDVVGDLLPIQLAGWTLRSAMETIADQGRGVVVVLHHAQPVDDIVKQLEKLDQPPAQQDEQQPGELRTYGVGAQILLDLGVRRMKVMGAPVKLSALSGFGLEIDDYFFEK